MAASESTSSQRRITAREREAQALELRKGGATLEQIGQALGINRSTAKRALDRALQRLADDHREDAEQVKAVENTRLDALFMAHWPKALAGHGEATDRILRIMERRAKLNGLDGPIKVQDVTDPENARARLAALLGLDKKEAPYESSASDMVEPATTGNE